MKIHVVCALIVVWLLFILDLTFIEQIMVIFTCFFVIILEIMNTGFELFVDVIHPEHDKRIGLAKDLMAGAVLLGSVFALLVALGILLPALLKYF